MAQSGWTRRDRQDFRSATLALEQNDLALVLQLLTPLHRIDSTFAPVNRMMGIALLDWKNDKAAALKHLQKAAEANVSDASFHYGRALHRTMQFDAAIHWYMRYLESGDGRIESNEVLRHIAITKTAIDAIANPVDVRVQNMGPDINTDNPEYVPVITPDNQRVYFTSRRNDSTGGMTDPNAAYFEDIYVSESQNGVWQPARNIGRPINSNTHDATVAISSDGNTMILYRTNENLTGGDLYLARYTNGQWGTPEKLPPAINSSFQEASATLSPDQNTLIFSSNRPGGYGGKDLYRVRRLPNGEWSLPKNLGPVINTPYDEDAPHLDLDGKTLYFASKGHLTMGGYDIFKSVNSGRDNWSIPVNLGYPVNTVDDDLYLSLDAGGRTGYFSSAREGGFGDQDLYSIDFVYRRTFTLVVKGETLNTTGDPISATITVIDESSREVQGVYRSNRLTGKFIAVLHPMTQYKLLIESNGYESVIDELRLPFPDDRNTTEVLLTPYMLRQP